MSDPASQDEYRRRIENLQAVLAGPATKPAANGTPHSMAYSPTLRIIVASVFSLSTPASTPRNFSLPRMNSPAAPAPPSRVLRVP